MRVCVRRAPETDDVGGPRGGWPRGLADLERLEHIRSLLTEQGHHVETATLALYSLHEFRPDLLEAAARRPDILLVDLGALYGDQPPVSGA